MAKNPRDVLTAEEVERYGFRWDRVDVTRECRMPGKKKGGAGGYDVLAIRTDHRTLDVYISPTGRSVRVFEGNVEWKPSEEDR